MFAELGSPALCHSSHRPLGGDVGSAPWVSTQPRGGGDVDDVAGVAPNEVLGRLARHQHRSEDVGAHHRLEVLQGELEERTEAAPAGIVHEGVVVGEPFDHGRDDSFGILFLADIARDRDRSDLLRRSLEHVDTPPGDGNRSSSLAKQPRGGQTDAGSSSGDQCPDVCDLHGASFLDPGSELKLGLR